MVEAKINQLLGQFIEKLLFAVLLYLCLSPTHFISSHGIPAVFYIGFGVFFLLLTLKRCRQVEAMTKKNHHQMSYSDVYPKENPLVLRRAGFVILICSLFGLIVEATGGMRGTQHGLFHQLAHESMYISYLFVGAIFVLEQKLYPYAHRYALSFTFLLCYFMWREHALMKEDMSDRRIHMLQAEVNFALFLSWGYSSKSLFSYVVSLGLITLNGSWLLTAGLAGSYCNLTMHMVAPLFVLEALFIASAIVVCTVAFLDAIAHDEKSRSIGSKYSTLPIVGNEGCKLQEYSTVDDEEHGLSIEVLQ